MSPQRRLRALVERGSLLLLGLVVACLGAEAALRLALASGRLAETEVARLVRSVEESRERRIDPSRQVFRLSSDSRLGWEPVPGFSTGHISINSRGFRGPEVSPEPPPGVRRIVVIGDSETFGMRLLPEDTFPGALEQALAVADPSTRYEVLNLGVPGYNTAQERRILTERALPLQPDTVLVYYVLNDPEPRTSTLLLGENRFARSHLYLFWVVARDRLDPRSSVRRSSESLADYYLRLHEPPHFDTVREDLLAMAAEASDAGSRMVLVIAPTLGGFETFEDYPFFPAHEALAALAAEDLTVLDPLPAVRDVGDPRSLWVASDDPHKGAHANHRVAAEVAHQLLEP